MIFGKLSPNHRVLIRSAIDLQPSRAALMVVKFSLKNVKLVKMNETIELDRFYARKKVSIVTCLLNSKPKDYTANNS